MAIGSGDESMPTLRVEGVQWAFSLPRKTLGLPTEKFVAAIQMTILGERTMLHDKSHGEREESFGLWLGPSRESVLPVQLIREVPSTDLLVERPAGCQQC